MSVLVTPAPCIMVTSFDRLRLSGVIEAYQQRGHGEMVQELALELERAQVVEPSAVPPDVVTMHSCCRFDSRGREHEVTLVYPGEDDPARGRVSIVTPVGTALIGLRSGRSTVERTRDGRMRAITLKEVIWQPEAHGLDGAAGVSG